MVGDDEGKLCEGGEEEEDDERVGEGDEEGCYEIMGQRALVVLLAFMYLLARIGAIAVNSEDE